MAEANKIKRNIARRRSKTPETLFREKSKGNGFKFRELPSHRAQPKSGFGFNAERRRSKSHGRLNDIVEEEKLELLGLGF